eukprot:4694000-Prymnesium_polylepis.1
MVEGFIASGFVPIYDSRPIVAATWRGRRYIDGGASDNAPIPFDGIPALVLSPHRWRDHGNYGTFPFVRADWPWLEAKFAEGLADAEAHHDEIASVLVERSQLTQD